MRHHDHSHYDADGQPYVVIERHETSVAPFLLGLALGAGAALLLAPRSGADTRRLMRERAQEARDAARRKVDALADSVTSNIAEVRDRLTDEVESVKSSVRRRRDDLFGALEAGRTAAAEARAELERRLAEQKQARSDVPDDTV